MVYKLPTTSTISMVSISNVDFIAAERFELRNFRALDPTTRGQPPSYIGDIPNFYKMYTNLVELLNKDTKKRRIIACNSKATAS